MTACPACARSRSGSGRILALCDRKRQCPHCDHQAQRGWIYVATPTKKPSSNGSVNASPSARRWSYSASARPQCSAGWSRASSRRWRIWAASSGGLPGLRWSILLGANADYGKSVLKYGARLRRQSCSNQRVSLLNYISPSTDSLLWSEL